MEKLIMKFVILCTLYTATFATSKSVFVYNNETKQLFTSSVLTWESFGLGDDISKFKYAVSGGHFDEDNFKAYICRGTINSVPVSGYVRKRVDEKTSEEQFLCIISQHQQFRTKGEFDLLINRGNGAKVEWTKWEKLSPYYKYNGLVSTGNGISTNEIYYVARHPRNHSVATEHLEIDHAIGFLDSDGLGKIYVQVASTGVSFEHGELLRVIEPARYELSDIKFSTSTLQQKSERIILGSTILKNEGNEEVDVSATIGYSYKIVRNFGQHEGVARSVNTTAFITKNEKFEFYWGIEKENTVVDSKSVSTRLLPGTALNVTLWGNYSTSEGPYKAYIVTYFADGSKSKKRHELFSLGFEQNLEEKLEIEYSPTYWLHNNTVMPTTTQRTTTSTSTQKAHKSIFATSMKNNQIERITGKPTHNELEGDEDENETSTASFLSEISFVGLVILSTLKVIL